MCNTCGLHPLMCIEQEEFPVTMFVKDDKDGLLAKAYADWYELAGYVADAMRWTGRKWRVVIRRADEVINQ